MKKVILITMITALCGGLTGCGSKDTKNEVENYPTTDTTRPMEKINDTISDEGQYGEGENRHNVNDK